jgi:hypothetical protein
MRKRLTMLGVFVLTMILISGATARQGKRDKKSPLPDSATWDLKALDRLFRVVKTEYDPETRRVKWTVETRDGHRTLDFVEAITRRPFTFRFLDGDRNELATIELGKEDFHGLLKERIMPARTPLTITLNLPRAMPRTKKVVLERGPS